MPEIKPVKVFTKDQPCTKLEIHNCFAGPHGYIARPVVEAQGEIGKNAPKHMLSKLYLVYRTVGNIDYYELTRTGTIWLHDGLAAYLKHHPDRQKDVKVVSSSVPKPATAVRVARSPRKA
jgi:hypothetical protein